MKRVITTLLVAWTAGHAVVAAQWITIKTPDAPRLPNGKINPSASAPSTSDGHPDLSGLWMTASTTPCPDLIRDGQDCQEKDIPSLQSINIGYGLPGGLPYQPWAAALVKERTAAFSKDDPHTHCLPSNTPRIWTLPHRQKIIQTPREVVILNEFSSAYRQIYTDGRALPVDPQPSWNGYSIGRWQGQTLIVETIGLSKNVWLDISGSPISEDARLTERIRRPDYGHLDVEVTVNDPKTYTRTWTTTVHESLQADIEMIDEVCLENEKSLQHMVSK
jgi:hypothetical protein